MTKKPTKPRVNYSKEIAWLWDRSSRLWLEQGPRHLMIMGPDGLWSGGWLKPYRSGRPALLSDSIRRPGGCELKLDSGVSASPVMGRITDWQASSVRNLGYVGRHYPQLLRPNYYYRTAGTTYQYSSGKYLVWLSLNEVRDKLSVAFSPRKIGLSRVWKKDSSHLSYQQQWAEYLLSQVLLPAEDWVDPRPWLELVDNFQVELTDDFKKAVYKKLISQFNTDFQAQASLSVVTSVDPTNLKTARQLLDQLKVGWYQLGRQAWWRSHFDTCLRLIVATQSFDSSQPVDIQPLSQFISKQLASPGPLYCNLNNGWFDNYLPVAPSSPPTKGQLHKLLVEFQQRVLNLNSGTVKSTALSRQWQARLVVGQRRQLPQKFSGYPLNVAELSQSLDNS